MDRIEVSNESLEWIGSNRQGSQSSITITDRGRLLPGLSARALQRDDKRARAEGIDTPSDRPIEPRPLSFVRPILGFFFLEAVHLPLRGGGGRKVGCCVPIRMGDTAVRAAVLIHGC